MIRYTYCELENEKFIKLNNQYINKKFILEHGIDSILILAAMLKCYTVRGEIIFNLNYLLSELGIKINNTTRINKVRLILYSLASANIIKTDIDFMTVSNNTTIRFDYDMSVDDFTIVYDFEIDNILNFDCKVDKYSLFYLFVFIKCKINPASKVMYWSILDMANELNTKSNKTIINYIDVLKEIGLIKVDNVGMRVFTNGDVKNSNNIYTLGYLEDSELILAKQKDKYKSELEEHNIRLENGKKSKQQTSVKLKLNSLWNKYYGEIITDSEMDSLYKLEEEYYNYIKLDEEKLNNTKFVLYRLDLL